MRLRSMHHGMKRNKTYYLPTTCIRSSRAISCRSQLRNSKLPRTPTWLKSLSTYPSLHAKRRSVVKVANLAQGMLPKMSSAEEVMDDSPQYPTVVLQARNNMRRFENCVLLTRVGGFYELYFEHAEEYGPLLNLKVACKRTVAGPVSMVLFTSIHSFSCFSRLYRQDFRSSNSTDS